ncbi:hypothetical protein LguiA_017071 [Lonicera macranthoides]
MAIITETETLENGDGSSEPASSQTQVSGSVEFSAEFDTTTTRVLYGVENIGSNSVLNGDFCDGKEVYNENGITLIVDVTGSFTNGTESEKICGCEDNNGHKRETNSNTKGDGDGMVDQDHQYVVGDFVWGKIRNLFTNYSWWPGRIYDPSDASDYAAKYKREDPSLLVAYFGDGSFSWCHPSQLKPFAENFREMSKQSSARSFVNAVQEALDEIGWLLGLKMACSCLPEATPTRVGTRSVNAGIRPGVHVPEGRIGELLCEPAELLARLRNFAQLIHTDNLLEVCLLKSWLTAFYRAKGRYPLAVYHEPMYIEGLEEKDINGVKLKSDFCKPMEVGVQVPFEVDLNSSPISTENEVQSVENGKLKGEKANDGTVLKAPKRKQVSSVEYDSGEGEEETAKSFSSRKIKRSRYLSPPFMQFPEELGIELDIMEEDHKNTTNSVKLNPTLSEVLSEVRFAALNPFHMMDNGHLDIIKRTIFTFRSSMFLKGSNYKAYNHPPVSGLIEPKSRLGEHQMNERMDIPKFKQAARECGTKDGKDSSVALVLTFPPGFSLPSKSELIKIFGKYGALNETETDVFYDSFYARVVFFKGSDAEEAFTESGQKSPFGADNINFRLCYSSDTPSRACEFDQKASSPFTNMQKGNQLSSKLFDDEGLQLGYVRQKLEMMASMLEDGGTEISAEIKSKLEGEMKALLEVVNTMIGSNSST